MSLSNQLLFLLAGLGVANGLLLATYFLGFLKPRKWVNLLFGLLLLVLCIRIGKSLFHAFSEVPRVYRQLALSPFVLVGPLLYLYLKSFISKIKKPGQFDLWHLSLPIVLVVAFGSIWPYERFPDFWNFQMIPFIYSVWVIYMIVSFGVVFPIIKKAFQQQGKTSEYWLLLIYSCVLVLCIAYVAAYFGFPYLAGPILFSIVLYVIIAFFVGKKNRAIVLQEESEKYKNQNISEEKADELLNRLSELMRTQRLYLNKKVKMAQVAESLDSTPHEVSQLINQKLGISFNTYINQFRVQAACQMLKEADHLTIEGIGQEVGFNSRSAFYLAFKMFMNQTPAQYKSKAFNSGM